MTANKISQDKKKKSTLFSAQTYRWADHALGRRTRWYNVNAQTQCTGPKLPFAWAWVEVDISWAGLGNLYK